MTTSCLPTRTQPRGRERGRGRGRGGGGRREGEREIERERERERETLNNEVERLSVNNYELCSNQLVTIVTFQSFCGVVEGESFQVPVPILHNSGYTFQILCVVCVCVGAGGGGVYVQSKDQAVIISPGLRLTQGSLIPRGVIAS